MEEGFAFWANPSSPHAEGRKAREALENARSRVKAVLGWDGEVIFTSGASEAAALALTRTKAGTRWVSAIEHDAVLQAAPVAERLVTARHSEIGLEETARAIAGDPRALVAIQSVNSETGNRQDIPALAGVVRDAGGLLLTDASQSAGKFPLPEGPDMVIVSAHKFGGPIGMGALLVRDFGMLEPAGGHERGYRRGTENLPGALGMAAALEACASPYVAPEVLEPLEVLAIECRGLGGSWLADRLSDPTPYICAIAMPGMSGSAQLMRFDMAGIAISQGSACSSGTMKRSHVLEAMHIESEVADRTIRVSVGWNTTRAEVERFCEIWLEMAKR